MYNLLLETEIKIAWFEMVLIRFLLENLISTLNLNKFKNTLIVKSPIP